jgi:hypothetical protein
MSRAQLTSTVEQNTGGAVAPIVGGKNFFANGAMDFWQRGTSFSLTSNTNAYTADRWSCYSYGATQTFSQSTTVPNTSFPYSLKIAGASGASASVVRQRIEAAATLPLANATSVTLSYWVYLASSSSASVFLNLNTPTSNVNDFTAVTSRVYQAVSGTAVNNAWTKITYTFNPSTFTNITYGLEVQLDLAAALNNASYYALFTGFQLELGPVATPFARAGGTLQGELALCQRYYFKANNAADSGGTVSSFAVNYSATAGISIYSLPVTMRVYPTAITYSGLRYVDAVLGIYANPTFTIGGGTPNNIRADFTSSGMTSGRSGWITQNSSTSDYIAFSAEL